MLIFITLVTFSLVVFVQIEFAQSIFPNQPPAFDTTRSTSPQPFLAFSFRQSGCKEGTISSDVDSMVNLTRSPTASTCPSSNGFENARIGFTINNTNEPNAIKSSSLGSAFDLVTTGLGSEKAKMSIEMWFSLSVTPPNSVENTLLEIGGDETNSDPNAFNSAETVFRITYQQNSLSNDILSIKLLFRDTNGDVTDNGLLSLSGGVLETIGNNPGQIFMIIVTISGTSVNAYVGSGTGPVQSKFGSWFDPELKEFVIPSNARLRLGCSRSVPSIRGFPGSIHFAAFYNTVLDETQANAFLAAGLPNSLPVVHAVSILGNEDEETSINLNQEDVVFDADDDDVSRFRILTLPTKGYLIYDGENVTEENFLVEDATLLKYKPDLDEFSILNGAEVCSTPYTSFTFDASDGLCDHTDTPDDSPNCNSPVFTTATICIHEMNDAPDVIDHEVPFTVFAEANNSQGFSITCRDRDNDTENFGLAQVVLTGQSNPALGKIYVVENGTGDCTAEGILIEDFESLDDGKIAINMSRVVGKNEDYTWHFCYIAEPTAVTTVDVGTDIISFDCVDQAQDSTPGEVHLAVKNAIIAGCGLANSTRAEWAAKIPCTVIGMEDEPIFITLNGLDVVSSHTPNRRLYRIVTLPSMGTLKTLNGSIVTPGQVLEGHLGNLVDVVGIDGVNNYPTTAGNLTLVYYPNPDHFTAICCLNRDPNNLTSVERHATCPSGCGTWPKYIDGLGNPINNCGNPNGCPVNFSFAIGYLDEGDVQSFSETLDAGVQITILGVNDPVKEEYIQFPEKFTMSRSSTQYPMNNITKEFDIGYFDPDGDTYRVGFHIFSNRTRVTLKIIEFDNPIVFDDKKRLTWHDDSDFCYDNGVENCKLRGKAYMSDLNRMLNLILLSTTQSSSKLNDSFIIRIYDPVSEPEQLDPQFQFYVNEPFVEKFMVVSFGSTSESDLYGLISAALWAGIGAGLFFVAMSCFAFWGCIISRAKRGEEAAVWAVKNLLCTDVEHRHNVDLSKMATGGRKSLEHAIHAEHARLARVVCCALFMHKMCPCLVKFDEKDLKVPDEESMLQEAVNQTRKRIASLHRPKDSPDGAIPVAKAVDPDVEDVVKEDELVDDSIFDWERHLDDKTGRVFYYNVKTHESRWKPPTVKVHEQRKIADRTSVKGEALFQPKPPDAPKNNGNNNNGGGGDDADADRVKKAS